MDANTYQRAAGRTMMIAALSIAGAIACSADRGQVARLLAAEGCTDTVVGGWDFGCSDSDSFANRFTCTKNGVQVTGVVCSGWLKGYTVRYEAAP